MNNGRCATCFITRYDDECEDFDKEYCEEFWKQTQKFSGLVNSWGVKSDSC